MGHIPRNLDGMADEGLSSGKLPQVALDQQQAAAGDGCRQAGRHAGLGTVAQVREEGAVGIWGCEHHDHACTRQQDNVSTWQIDW